MSLRLRLNVLVSLLSVAIVVLGAGLVIHNARRAVFEEVVSTAHLVTQLLAVASNDLAAAPEARETLRSRLDEIDEVRHLRITVVEDGRESPLPEPGRDPAEVRAPAWFTRLVEPPPAEHRIEIASPDSPVIVLTTDPGDEIDEVWADAPGVLGLLIAFVVVANAVFFVAVGRWLRPLEHIVAALEGIERGRYAARLPPFALPELTALSRRFNMMAETLEHSRAENQALTRRSLAIQEDERRHLARELHDEFGQSISAIKAVAVSLGQRHGDEVRSAAATIEDAATRVYSAVTDLIRQLRPSRLDEFGLLPALEELVDNWNDRNADAFCSLVARGRFDSLGEAAEINLYRIVQESLTNAEKHSGARRVRIELDAEAAAGLRLRIRDDGEGFDLERASRGLGLLGMRERVEGLGGVFTLETAPGEGVAISIEVPLVSAASAA